MSEKNKVTDPLLGGDESSAKIPDKTERVGKSVEEPAKVEAKTATPKSAMTPDAQIKANAIAKFPNDTVAQTKYILDNSEHISFLVPQLEGEVGVEEVQINGYKMTVPKNVPVSIPKQVAALIAEKYKINMEAGKEKRADRASDVADALS